ncbi:MAG TPA: hypothetical protein PK323_02465 [Bacteroidia bacterium]|nr:hypothetical protein [Bacteroidia bacterium]
MKKQIRMLWFAILISITYTSEMMAQITNTQIKGFVDVLGSYQKEKGSFSLGEQDLFITSDLSDRVSFLGESVFKYSATSPTLFDVSIERIILKYNYKGNHNFLAGKHHTPLNYWNDTYHHGRVFFPTIFRPLMFNSGIIPLHTTGVSLQGLNLGKLKFGYDIMVGNGLGSNDVLDNNIYKSITAAFHIKPIDGLRIGASYYRDILSSNALSTHLHGGTVNQLSKSLTQELMTGSVAYFKGKYEFLSEGTIAINNTDSTGRAQSAIMYAYAGYRVKDKYIPYVRFDWSEFARNEIYFLKDNTTSYLIGFRYQINYLAVVKFEYEHSKSARAGMVDKYTAQFAIGF